MHFSSANIKKTTILFIVITTLIIFLSIWHLNGRGGGDIRKLCYRKMFNVNFD